MKESENSKIERVLGIYTKFINGQPVNRMEEAQRYRVDKRTIQRDIDDIRDFLALEAGESGVINTIDFDKRRKRYTMVQTYNMKLSNSEILALCKILLDSRAFVKEEMDEMLKKLIACCVPRENQKQVKDLVGNEAFHYVELQHKTRFLETMWDIGQAVSNCQYIEIDYARTKDRKVVTRKLKPVAIMFSEYYFYLTAFIDDEEVRKDFDVLNDSFPTIYRIDRIRKLNVLNEKFHIPYSDRFQEGEFRKRIQFMFGGRLQKVKFKYFGDNTEAILDRLPTAKILSKDEGVYIISAEVFGKGIDMWLRSQGEMVEVITQ